MRSLATAVLCMLLTAPRGAGQLTERTTTKTEGKPMKTIMIMAAIAAAFFSTGAEAARHRTSLGTPYIDVAAIPAYAPMTAQRQARPRYYQVAARREHHRSPGARWAPQTSVHTAAAPTQPAPAASAPADARAAALGDLLGVAEGWADGMATAASHAIGGCGVSFRHNLVDCKTGASTSVSAAMLPHAQCLLRWLDAVGYRVKDIGGFGERHNASAHPTGNALDIDQVARNVTTHRLPDGVTAAAASCGLVHGAIWSNPDAGHFEMPGKFGYTGLGRHYASRHSGHRYAAIVRRRYVHHVGRRHYAGA